MKRYVYGWAEGVKEGSTSSEDTRKIYAEKSKEWLKDFIAGFMSSDPESIKNIKKLIVYSKLDIDDNTKKRYKWETN